MASAAQPAITSWTRLEPQPRDASLARSLQAQIRDPLWLLTRQWQVGEFGGGGAGSPVQAVLGVETQAITGYRPGPPGGTVVPFDQALPLEVHVEREPARFQVRGSVQLGLLFEERVSASAVASAAAVIDAFRAAFPIATADPDPALAGATGLQLRALAAGQITDGEALYWSAVTAQAGGTPVPPLPPQASDPAVAAVLADFVTFRQSAFSQPAADPAWQGTGLDYSFAVESASTTGESVVLEADTFPGGHLDWYSFVTGQAATATQPQDPVFTSQNFLPVHVTFGGMPTDRWWNFEDSASDLGELNIQNVDLPTLLVMEFAFVYGTDWFFVPVPSQFGCLQRVTTLVITDTFGERTLIRPVEQYPVAGSSRPWSVFKISGSDGQPSDFIVLAPVLGLTDDADALEDVLFLRDNTAALAWAVEQKLQGSADLPVNGYETYLARLAADPALAPAPAAPSSADIAYTLEYPPPDNWIPFVPVLTQSGEMMFRRGTMDIPGPGGTVVQLQPNAEILQPTTPYYLTDRVITPTGVEATRYLRRTRWTDGSTLVWMARQSGPGTGPGSSGLKFDFLRAADTGGQPAAEHQQAPPSPPPAAPPPVSPTATTVSFPAVPAASTLQMHVISGADAGRAFDLHPGAQIIGREEGSEILLDDPTVSHNHAVVRVHGEQVTIEDLRSTNGTKVNGVAIEHPTSLTPGDQLDLGGLKLVIEQHQTAGPGGSLRRDTHYRRQGSEGSPQCRCRKRMPVPLQIPRPV